MSCQLYSYPKVALFLGSGFSAASGLPTTSTLSKELIDPQKDNASDEALEAFISRTIGEFWAVVFGWRPGAQPPSLEDHFTQIDLAANSGHYLGPGYDPKRLRAIRRMTIHRILTRLGSPRSAIESIVDLFRKLRSVFDITVITTNWDVEAERHLEELDVAVDDGLDPLSEPETAYNPPMNLIRVLKLHGCINRAYCDCCRMIVGVDITKAVPSLDVLLRPDDFRLFDEDIAQVLVERQTPERMGLYKALRKCSLCGVELGVRIGTFSYRKDLNPSAFYSVWDKAQADLQSAQRWLFIGYSLPDADVEIRHLLKFTQLARTTASKLSIEVVLQNDSDAENRYQRFFGLSSQQIFQEGIKEWVTKRLNAYCA